MDNLTPQPISSGMMSAEECENWSRNCANLYAGYNPPEKTSEAAGWASAPVSWNMRHRFELEATKCGVYINFTNTETTGLFIKRTTFSYRVTGLESKVDRFISWVNSL